VTTVANHDVTCQSGDVDFDFVAGRPALDFVATVAERGTSHLERLATTTDLADWIVAADLLDKRLSISQAELDTAKELREVIFAAVTAWTQQSSLAERHRKTVNAAAALAPPTPLLGRDGRVHRDGRLDAVLAALARDAIDLAGSPDLALVRWCADQSCTRPFVDRSRGHRRRWCGMRGCGDRAKAAAYRRRRRAEPRG
jgi:predicted RNA-binding Zn ribbon-like protein